MLLGNGDGTFATAVSFPTGPSPNTVALADLNNDGLPDLSTAEFGSNSVSVRLDTYFRPTFQLLAPDGTTVLGSSAASSNLAAEINGFVAPAAGTYFVRVTGAGSAGYDLVVTRGGVFDTEPNDSFNSPQNIDGVQGVLGYAGDVTVLDSFDSGPADLTSYTFVTTGAANITDVAAHDGPYGLELDNATDWIYRNDATAHVQQGDTISWWVDPATTGLGRAYLGFGASAHGDAVRGRGNQFQ